MSFVHKMLVRCGCRDDAETTPAPKRADPDEEDEPKEESRTEGRAQWASPTEFLLTCVGYSVGLGNVWRFPYLCYKSGGGAFMLPYCLMICFIGMPLLFMEYGFGQYFGIGSLSIFKKVCPMFQGIGMGYVVLNALVCIYYNVIIALSLYYLFASFQKNLPWASCNNEWNTENCVDYETNITGVNGTLGGINSTFFGSFNSLMGNGTGNLTANWTDPYANRTSPTEEFFQLKLLGREDHHNVSDLGEIRWQLCLCLLLAWILVVLFVSRGIQSTGKVAYFTATFPYVMLTVLVVRGVTLPGASKGVLYFLTPQWDKLGDPEIWYSAATQLFYSTNLAWGGMITMASYNSFNHNCYRDAIMINIVSFLTSLYAGFAVFSIIGFMAQENNLDIEKVIKSGPELAFVVYPRALSLMPLAPMWSALFFFMLFLLGIGSQMVLIETVVTGFVDEFPRLGLNPCVRFTTMVVMVTAFFLCGLPSTFQMVILETVVTGFVDEFPRLGLNPLIRFLTTVSVAVLFFLCGIASTTQMVQTETIMTSFVDRWPHLALNWRRRILMVICVCSVGFFIGVPMTTKMVDAETVMTGIMDEFPALKRCRFLILCLVCFVFFLTGLPMVTQGGMHVLQLMDHYAAGFCVLVIAVVECIVINWIYKNERFAANMKEMLSHKPHMWWRICWKYISPLLLTAVLIYSLVDFTRARYGAYQYPLWADAIGLFMTLASVLPIFIVAGWKLYKAPGADIKEKWFSVTTPQIESQVEAVKGVETNHKTNKPLNDVESGGAVLAASVHDDGRGDDDGDAANTTTAPLMANNSHDAATHTSRV